ncbi:MAG: DUF4199 domain-containing protein [Bacteroidota bacterium]
MRYKAELKWGIMLFVATIVWVLFEKLMGWHSDNIDQHAVYSALYDVVFVLIFAFAYKSRRRQVSMENFQWKDRLTLGLGITLVITILSPLTQAIIHKMISPMFFENIIKLAVDNDLMSIQEAEAKFNLPNYIVENLIGTFILGLICTLALSFFFRNRNVETS